jgi:hypothetical protein
MRVGKAYAAATAMPPGAKRRAAGVAAARIVGD